MLGEHLLEGLTINAARIEQRLSDLVPEHLLEPAVLEAAATQVPVRFRLLRIREHLATLVAHELVVDLTQTPRPRPAPRQCLAREVVVIDDVDVVVQMPTGTVGVCDDEVVRAVHPACELHAELVHTLHVLRTVHVELLGGEVLCIGVHLVAAMERSRDLLGTPDDLLGRVERAREQSSTCRAVLQVLRTPLAGAEQRVCDGCSCARGRLDVDGTHRATSSPSSDRTSRTASRTSRRMSSSTALPERTT